MLDPTVAAPSVKKVPPAQETVELNVPFTRGGATLGTLTLRRPTVKDRIIAEKRMTANPNMTDHEQECSLLSQICMEGMAPDEFQVLDYSDFMKLQQKVREMQTFKA